jgi:threonine synthase
MDILISSNLERLLYLVTGEDDALIRDWFGQLATNGKYEVNDTVKAVLKEEFYGGYCDDVDTKKTIKEIYDKYGYTCDTHTAVAVKVYEDYKSQTGDDNKTIIASTASPYKFSASVLEAIDGKVADIDEYDMVNILNERSNMPIPQSLAELKGKERRFNGTIEKTQMEEFVLENLGL